MIFLTVGTHEPFDRLVQAVDEWCAGRDAAPEILGQITSRASYQPKQFRAVETLAPSAYSRCFSEADFIISHAGMGSIITALSLQKPIVILPRRGHLQETRNDHQFATMQRFSDKPGIFVAEDETALPEVLNQVINASAAPGEGLSPFASEDLIAALRKFIHDGDV